MRLRLASLTIALVAVSQLGATDCGQIIEDPGFDHWCGDQLCYWKVERGGIQRVPTWHAGDDGAELVGEDVAISQVTAVTSTDTDCIRFELLANIEETAEVRLEADVFDDGSVDWSERIPTSAWERLTYRIGVRGSYEGITFRITKAGYGHAVVAQIAAEVAPADEPCPSFVDVAPRPLGGRCAEAADCASGICNAGVCSVCESDADCGADVCGRELGAPGGRQDWHTCVPSGSRPLGEICFVDDECATGLCNGALCSECSDAVPCGPGRECRRYEDERFPLDTCDQAPSGAACVRGDQCAGDATCGGCRWVGFCNDAPWELCHEDGECPVQPDLSRSTCILVALTGATCD